MSPAPAWRRLLVAAGCAFTVTTVADGRVPVAELLAGRTAHWESAGVTRLVYHHADGRMAWAADAGGPIVGRWWVDDDGLYCHEPADGIGGRCYVASMSGSTLLFENENDASTSIVSRLEPGDARRLMADEAEAPGPCDCRLTTRRRVDSGAQ